MELSEAHGTVINFFNAIRPINKSLQDAIRKHSSIIKVPPKTIITDIGVTHKYIYFIIKGAIRTFYRDKDLNEITSWLLFEGDLAISVCSFFSQSPGFEAMEALERCTLLTISYDNLNELYRCHPDFNFIGRVLTEKYYTRSEEKANLLRSFTAMERYIHLMNVSPEVLNRVSLKYIASYLGITQSTLSRIRATKKSKQFNTI